MKSSRTQILSFNEVSEAVKAYIKQKYHERIDKEDPLTSMVVNNEDSSVSFTFMEVVMPYVKHKSKV